LSLKFILLTPVDSAHGTERRMAKFLDAEVMILGLLWLKLGGGRAARNPSNWLWWESSRKTITGEWGQTDRCTFTVA
jgi:hypothetical protein